MKWHPEKKNDDVEFIDQCMYLWLVGYISLFCPGSNSIERNSVVCDIDQYC